jgi:hypothetical protein
MDLSLYDLPLSEVEKQLKGLVDEALTLRFKTEESANLDISSPRTIIASLLNCRARLDRLEEILTVAARARGRAYRAAQEARRVADEAWDAVSAAARTGPSRRSEYTGAKEHYADNNLATLSQQRSARIAERLADYATESHNVIKIVYHGLDNYRSDHLVIIRALSFESHLERTSTDRGY